MISHGGGVLIDKAGGGAGLSGVGIYFSSAGVSTIDPAVNGAWFITLSASNLSFQRRESGVYVEKTADAP